VPNASISEWRVEYNDNTPIFYTDRVGDVHFIESALDEVDK